MSTPGIRAERHHTGVMTVVIQPDQVDAIRYALAIYGTESVPLAHLLEAMRSPRHINPRGGSNL